MAAKSYAAGEWVLLSLRPFLSEETLTVSMKDGEVFTIKVTDVQIVKNVLTADGENYIITITYSDEAEIPDRSDFNVTEILPSSDDYQNYVADSARELNIAAGDVAYARFFDIEIVKDRKKVEPKAPVHVKIEHEDPLGATLGTELSIVHFAESGAEIIDDVKLSDDLKEINYEQNSFSVTGEIISNPSKGSDASPKQYVLIVKYEGAYYSVDSDGTLTPVTSVDDPENPTTVTVGSAMVWSYDNNGTLYHHTDATDLNAGRVAADYYYKYIDISTSDDGVYEEQSYRQMTGEDVPFQKDSNGDFNAAGIPAAYLNHTEEQILHTRDVDLWASTTPHLVGERNAWVAKEHKNAGLFKVNYDPSTHKLTSENGYVLDVAKDDKGNLRISRTLADAGTTNGVELFFTNVVEDDADSVPSVSPYNHTVDHIDISVDGNVDVGVSLAYGIYYDENHNPILKVENGNYFEWSGGEWVPALDASGKQYTNKNPLKVSKKIELTDEDIKSATIKAMRSDGTEVDNAYYVSGYSSNAPDNDDTWQVRIEGSFKVADLPPANPADYGLNPNHQDLTNARKNNVVYYSVSTVLHNQDVSVKYGDTVLYNGQGDPMNVKADIAIDSAKFNYWDQDNKCPPLNNNAYNMNGSIYVGPFDANDKNWWLSGIDYRLTGDKVNATAELLGMETTKYIVDTAGNVIHISEPITSTFHVYEKQETDDGYDTDSVKLVNGGEAAINPKGDQQSGTLPADGTYSAPDDSIYEGYSPHTEYDMIVQVGTNGVGLEHNYKVTEGMYYIVEDPSTVTNNQTLTDDEGNTYRYVRTHLESEYASREDRYSTEKYGGTYTEPVHVSPNYSDPDSEEYKSVPEVIGSFKNVNGKWVREDGRPIRNTFLEFFVYNVYEPDVKLDVEKHWNNTEEPEGAEVIVELYYAKQMVKNADGEKLTLQEWPSKDTYQKVVGATWESGEAIFENSVTSQSPMTLKADADEEKNWKGTFKNLPHHLTDADGNVWEFDYFAKETSVTVNGVEVKNQYDTAERKTEPTQEESHYSDGKVDVINAEGGLTVEKKWLNADGVTEMTPPADTSAEITAELWRKRTVTVPGEPVEVPGTLVNVTIQAHAPDYRNGQMIQLWSKPVRKGSTMKFSVACNGTGRPTMTTDGGVTIPDSGEKHDVTGNSTDGDTNFVKNGAGVYILEVTGPTVITASIPEGKVKTNGSPQGIGWDVFQYDPNPGTELVPGEPVTQIENERVNLPAKIENEQIVRPAVENGILKLNSVNGWKFTLSAADMDPGWEYYIKDDVNGITESGISASEFTYVSPVKTTTTDGYTVYTAKNISKKVPGTINVQKKWFDADNNDVTATTTETSISFDIYRVKHVHEWDEENLIVDTAPTDTEPGTGHYVCKHDGCTATYQKSIPALGCEMGEWEVTTDPTCTELGERTRVCKNNPDHIETDPVPALGHTAGDWEVKTEAECEETGERVRKCTVCGAEVDWDTIPALGHDWDEGVVTKEPTEYEEGIRTYTCRRNASHTKTTVIPKIISTVQLTIVDRHWSNGAATDTVRDTRTVRVGSVCKIWVLNGWGNEVENVSANDIRMPRTSGDTKSQYINNGNRTTEAWTTTITGDTTILIDWDYGSEGMYQMEISNPNTSNGTASSPKMLMAAPRKAPTAVTSGVTGYAELDQMIGKVGYTDDEGDHKYYVVEKYNDTTETLGKNDGWTKSYTVDMTDDSGVEWKYYFVETVPDPNGGVYEVSYENQGIGKDGTTTIKNKEVPTTGSIKITKEVTIHNQPVAEENTEATPADGEYTFEVTKKDDDTFAKHIVTLTIVNGKAVTSEEISGLEPGIYIVTEVDPNNGTAVTEIDGSAVYEGTNSKEITVAAGDNGAHAVSLTFTNNYESGEVSFTKTDGTEGLPDATFALYKTYEDGELSDPLMIDGTAVTAVSGPDGTVSFTDIPVGNYYMKETEAPSGYVLSPQLYSVSIKDGSSASKVSKIFAADGTEVTEVVNIPTPDNPDAPPVQVENHKRIDALRDEVENPDSPHTGEELTDLYRLYLDYKINSIQEPEGIDLLFVLDHSGSMNSTQSGGDPRRAPTIQALLNGNDGLISEFLEMNANNRWAAVGFKGESGVVYTLNPLFRQPNAGINDSEILSAGSGWNTSVSDVLLPNEGRTILTDYTAGFYRAEQFLNNNDGRKKVVIFISDGLPTLYIPCVGTLENAGTTEGSRYYPAETGGCVSQTLQQFDNFLSDLDNYGYTFGTDIELYTIGFGYSILGNGGQAILDSMVNKAYAGTDVSAADHSFGFDDGNVTATADAMRQVLRGALGLAESFDHIVIQDKLSKYVDIYGLEAGASSDDILKAAGTKITMTDPNNPSGEIVLYDAADNTTNHGFTTAGAAILKSVVYNAADKTVTATFKDDYKAMSGITYTLSFDVKASDTAYTEFAAADKGQEYGLVVGDLDTDYLGTDPANATSAGKPGYHSNDSATVSYEHTKDGTPTDESKDYPKPVIQVFEAPIEFLKTDQTGTALGGAKFNLYNENYDTSKEWDDASNAACKINTSALVSEVETVILDDGTELKKAAISVTKLKHGTYYLVETEAPTGYLGLEGPIKIEVTVDENDTVSVEASMNGKKLTYPVLQQVTAGDNDWQLKVMNSNGAVLPNAGGHGTMLYYLMGLMLIAAAGIGIALKRRLGRYCSQ